MNGASPLSSSQLEVATRTARLLAAPSSTRARAESGLAAGDCSLSSSSANSSKVLDKLVQKVLANDGRVDGQERSLEDAKERLGKLEESLVKIRSDHSYAQLLLENLAAVVEKEKGVVSEHTEQLRFFATQSRQQRADGSSSRSLYYAALTWLYTPFLLFVKGLWLVLQPILMTMRSLSLFNAAVLREQQQRPEDQTDDDDDEDKFLEKRGDDEEAGLEGRKEGAGRRRRRRSGAGAGSAPAPSLLTMLQQGALDPTQKKKR